MIVIVAWKKGKEAAERPFASVARSRSGDPVELSADAHDEDGLGEIRRDSRSK